MIGVTEFVLDDYIPVLSSRQLAIFRQLPPTEVGGLSLI